MARPNFVLITADDMNWDAVGAFGCPTAGTTPNIDRFNPWSDGVRAFRNESQNGRSWQAMEAAAASDSELAARNHLFTYRVLEEFYDFANDPNALHNLIDDPNYAGEIQGLRNALEEWMVETDDPTLEAFRGRASQQALDDLMDHLADTIGKRVDE